jgi:hypothetical protein
LPDPQPTGGPSGTADKTRLLIGATAAVAVVAAVGVIMAPRLFGPGDPGCKMYTGTALTAYNQAINDLNAQVPQAKLTNDMSTATVDLQTAAAQAQSATVKSKIDGLIKELNTVRTDTGNGSVPASTVSALNTAANAADNAC